MGVEEEIGQEVFIKIYEEKKWIEMYNAYQTLNEFGKRINYDSSEIRVMKVSGEDERWKIVVMVKLGS